MENGEHDLPFKIELWDDADRHIEEVIALASDYASACGAYDEAVKRRPGKLVTLRQKARVIKRSRYWTATVAGNGSSRPTVMASD